LFHHLHGSSFRQVQGGTSKKKGRWAKQANGVWDWYFGHCKRMTAADEGEKRGPKEKEKRRKDDRKKFETYL